MGGIFLSRMMLKTIPLLWILFSCVVHNSPLLFYSYTPSSKDKQVENQSRGYILEDESFITQLTSVPIFSSVLQNCNKLILTFDLPILTREWLLDDEKSGDSLLIFNLFEMMDGASSLIFNSLYYNTTEILSSIPQLSPATCTTPIENIVYTISNVSEFSTQLDKLVSDQSKRYIISFDAKMSDANIISILQSVILKPSSKYASFTHPVIIIAYNSQPDVLSSKYHHSYSSNNPSVSKEDNTVKEKYLFDEIRIMNDALYICFFVLLVMIIFIALAVWFIISIQTSPNIGKRD